MGWGSKSKRDEPSASKADKNLLAAASRGDLEALGAALAAGAHVDAKNEDGWPAGMLAALRGDVGCLLMLIEGGANLEAKSNDGRTAAMIAAYHGKEGCLRALIEAGADIEAKDCYGRTASISAAWYGHETCLRMLIAAGADLGVKNNDGGTAGMWAARNGHEGCFRLLMAAEADIEANSNAAMIAAREEAKARAKEQAGAATDAENMGVVGSVGESKPPPEAEVTAAELREFMATVLVRLEALERLVATQNEKPREPSQSPPRRRPEPVAAMGVFAKTPPLR